MLRSRFLKTGSLALVLTFFVLIGQTTPALAFDNCRQRIEKAERQLHEAERRWMRSLSESEQRSLLRALAKIQANAPDADSASADG